MSDDLTVDEALAEADEARKFDDAKLRDSSRALIVLSDEVLRLRQAALDHDEWLLEVGKGASHE